MKEAFSAVIDAVAQHTEQHPDEFSVLFKNKEYVSERISRDKLKSLDVSLGEHRISFVDGGDRTLIRNPSILVSFIRIAACVYARGERTGSHTLEFFLVVKAIQQGFAVEFHPVKKCEGIAFSEQQFVLKDLEDSRIQTPIEQVSGIIRRTYELAMATYVAQTLNEKDAIVLDGTLETKHPFELEQMRFLADLVQQKKIVLSALAKTTSLLTNYGHSVTHALLRHPGMWHVRAGSIESVSHTAKIEFVRLHSQSKHVYRFESLSDPASLLSVLTFLSRDPSLLGYPYGLIDVDVLARVSNHEQLYLKTMLGAKLDVDALHVLDIHP